MSVSTTLYRRFQEWLSGRRESCSRQSRPSRAALHLEALEERMVLSTFVVTNAGDSDLPGSGGRPGPGHRRGTEAR